MRPEDVTFKTVDAQIEKSGDDDNKQTIDVCEITYPDGKVVAYPVDMVSPETGKPYREMFADKYKAFKNGQGDPDRIAQIEREIADKQEELKAAKSPNKFAGAKDDDRAADKSDARHGRRKASDD